MLFSFKPQAAAGNQNILKFSMLGGAAIIASVGFFLSTQKGFQPEVSYALYGVAVLEALLALALPRLMAVRLNTLEYVFQEDKIVVMQRGKAAMEIPYAKIQSVTQKPDGNSETMTELVNITLHLNETIRPGMTRDFRLEGLPAAESPLARIEQAVSKTKG